MPPRLTEVRAACWRAHAARKRAETSPESCWSRSVCSAPVAAAALARACAVTLCDQARRGSAVTQQRLPRLLQVVRQRRSWQGGVLFRALRSESLALNSDSLSRRASAKGALFLTPAASRFCVGLHSLQGQLQLGRTQLATALHQPLPLPALKSQPQTCCVLSSFFSSLV